MAVNDKPVVAIVGRPNVGKSTLFNRLIRRREAIVDDQPGITRDRKLAEAEWEGRHFQIMDTGGYIPKSFDVIETGVTEQVLMAVHEADLILFLVDVTTGITDVDEQVAVLLRKSGKASLVAVNKVDNDKREMELHEFYKLGLGEPMGISASLGRGIGDLLSAVVAALQAPGDAAENEPGQHEVRLAIIGRPNTGKSTFINTVLGENRMLVTEIPGTTRDSVDVEFIYKDVKFTLIDTAGLRRRTHIHESVEYYSVLRTKRVISSCELACIFIDATESVAQQDMNVIKQAADARKGLVVVINKWDLVRNDPDKKMEWDDMLDQKMQGLQYIPVLKVSCKTGYNLKSVMETAVTVSRERARRVPSPILNQIIEKINHQLQHPSVKGRHIRIMYASQVGVNPPVFALFTNHPKLIESSYKRFLENQFRKHFGFHGVPLTLNFKQK
jgi:GTP-binding protein